MSIGEPLLTVSFDVPKVNPPVRVALVPSGLVTTTLTDAAA